MLNLVDKNKCTGCSACVNACPEQCIEMKKDSFGFAYPEVDAVACVKCGKCVKLCPVMQDTSLKIDLPLTYAALSLDEKVRMESSSGGVFTELAKGIICQKGVVYGAAYNEYFEVCHCSIESTDDLYKLRGAKYSESNLGNCFAEILERIQKNQLVLFSGTPCQVAGLKSFVKRDFDNLFCVDFVCHGVPSPMVWKSYVEYRAEEDANGEMPCDINLRSKNTGWSKYQYSNVFKYENGKQHSELSSQSLFMRLFVGNYISRTSCETCKFKGYNRISDITLGDFWGIWDIAPEMDDDKGTSVVLVHSPKGRRLWENINFNIKCKEVSIKQASEHNPSMLVPAKANIMRNFALEKIKEGNIETCKKLFEQSKSLSFTRLKKCAERLFVKSKV